INSTSLSLQYCLPKMINSALDETQVKQYLADSPPSVVPLAIKPHFEALNDQEKLYAHYVSVYGIFGDIKSELTLAEPRFLARGSSSGNAAQSPRPSTTSSSPCMPTSAATGRRPSKRPASR